MDQCAAMAEETPAPLSGWEKMMGSAARKRKWHAQPVGKPKGGHSWDHYEAKWVPDEAPVSGTDASLVPLDGAGGAATEAAGAQAEKKEGPAPHVFQRLEGRDGRFAPRLDFYRGGSVRLSV